MPRWSRKRLPRRRRWAQQTEELARLVSRFRTGDDNTVIEMSSRRETGKPLPRTARPSAKQKLAANGTARRQAAADAGWEEF